MARTLLNSQRWLAVILAVTVIHAFLPGSAQGISSVLAEVFRIVMHPFTDPLNRLGSVLRPAADRSGVDWNDRELVEHLHDQLIDFERLYYAEQEKVSALERQLEQIQKVPAEYMQTSVQRISAHVGLRTPTSALGTVTVSRGTNHGVKLGSIAVYNGVELLGRISEVSAVHSTLLPLANRDTGWIKGAVLPKDRKETIMANVPRISLQPTGDGAFVAQADRILVINKGDEVILIDESWPRSAQAMKIGIVESVNVNDMEPLRNTVVVRPAYQVSQVSSVVLKVEVESGDSAPESTQP